MRVAGTTPAAFVFTDLSAAINSKGSMRIVHDACVHPQDVTVHHLIFASGVADVIIHLRISRTIQGVRSDNTIKRILHTHFHIVQICDKTDRSQHSDGVNSGVRSALSNSIMTGVHQTTMAFISSAMTCKLSLILFKVHTTNNSDIAMQKVTRNYLTSRFLNAK